MNAMRPGGPAHTTRRLDRGRALTLLASAVSGLATFTGMRELTGGGPTGLLYALAFTVLVQLAILWAVERIAAARGLGRLGPAAVYATAVTVSVGFGYGFFYDLLSAAQRSAESRAELRAAVARQLAGFAGHYRDFADMVAAAAAWSARQAEIERKRGGTGGGRAEPGAGPRTRLRLREAAILDEFARHFRERAARVEELARRMDALLADAGRPPAEVTGEVRRLHAEAAAYARDPRLAELRAFAEGRITRGRTGFVDPRTGERFTCADPELERRLAALLAVPPPEPPGALPSLFAGDRPASLRHALGVVMALVAPGSAPALDPALDLPPLLAALAVDLLLLQLGLQRGARPRLRAYPAPEGEAVFDERLNGSLRARAAADGDVVLDLLETHSVVWRRGCVLLLVPHAAGARARALRRAAHHLEARGMLHFLGERRTDRLARRLPAAHRALLEGADRTVVYRWDTDAWRHYWLDPSPPPPPVPSASPVPPVPRRPRVVA